MTGRRSYADAAYLDEALTEPLLRLEEALVPAREGLADSALRPAAA